MSTRILIIEDHEDNRRILRDLLTAHGYTTLEAVNGADGISAALDWQPDLILLDIQLPDIEGYEVAHRIKSDINVRRMIVIAVTSYAMSGDEQRAREAGCDDYIAKPYSPRALLGVIRKHLEGI